MVIINTRPPKTKFGRLYAPDPRDAQFPLKRPRFVFPRTERMWQTAVVVQNQGEEPACVGFSGYHFLTAAPYMERIGRNLPTPMHLYKLSQQFDEWAGEDYEGSSVRGLMKALVSLNIISEYRWALDASTFRSHLLHRGPLNVGTDWFSEMSQPRSDGFLVPRGEYEGGHAWLVIGYSKKRDAYRMLNSWGPDWGQKGRAWIDAQTMEHLIFGMNGEAASAIEKKV